MTASTTTRWTTRRSGNQMGDQINPGDQIFDQNVKIRSPIWSPGAIWWSDEACFSSHLFKRPLIFSQKAQLQSKLSTVELHYSRKNGRHITFYYIGFFYYFGFLCCSGDLTTWRRQGILEQCISIL